MDDLFDETEEDGDDDGGLQGLTKDDEEDWDGEDVWHPGEMGGEERESTKVGKGKGRTNDSRINTRRDEGMVERRMMC